MRLYADVLGFAGGKEEALQECRMGEDGICFGAGKEKLQVMGREQIILRAPEIALDAVQIIGVGFLDTSKFILLTGFAVTEVRSFGRFQVIVSG